MKKLIALVTESSLRCFTVGFLLGTVVGYAALQNAYLSGSLVWSLVGFLAGVFVGYIIKTEVLLHRDHT